MNNKENIFQNKHNSDWKYLPMNILGETFGGLSGKTKDNFNNGNKKYISYSTFAAQNRQVCLDIIGQTCKPIKLRKLSYNISLRWEIK